MTITLDDPQTHDDSAVFPLLADPDGYEACMWDLAEEDQRRAYWLDLFGGHFPKLLREAKKDAGDRGEDIEARAEQAQEQFSAYLALLAETPNAFGRLTIMDICWQRERVLRQAGIDDPYRLAKRTENELAMAKLPALLGELDATPAGARALSVLKGVFAGNIYDLGASKTIDMFADESVDFDSVRGRLKDRPWHVDDADGWLERLGGPAHRCACLFVDNAGPDICLGMLPLARELLQRGTGVILSANSEPSLNDITHAELVGLVEQASAFDPVLAEAYRDDRLTLTPSGNWAPLIDLTRVSPALAEAVDRRGVDLVVIEGMGRAVESNFDASLACDCLKIAMIKDHGVADTLGAELFDLVCKFEPGPVSSPGG